MSKPQFPSAVFFGLCFDTNKQQSSSFSEEELGENLHNPDCFVWIDVQSPDISEVNEVLGQFGIDLKLVSHFGTPEVLPRIVEHPDCLAFYLYEIIAPDRHLDTSEEIREIAFGRMLMVLGRDFVITYHRRPLEAVDHIKSNCEDAFQLAGRTPAFVVFLFLQRCLYDFAHLNLANDNFLDAQGDAVGESDPDELREQVLVAGANILTLKKLVASLRIVLMAMGTKRSRFISEQARQSFLDMLQHAQATREAIDSSRDMLDGIVAGMQAVSAGRTAEIARVLTVVSAIFLPLSLLAGVYGMNFDHMPELHWEHGYATMLGVMVGVAGVLLGLFWKLGWFSDRGS